MSLVQETAFEKPRGVSNVELRPGYAQVQVTGLQEPLAEERLRVLGAIAGAGISLDFLKLTQSGVSFLIPEALSDKAAKALKMLERSFDIQKGRSVVQIQATNLRDEEGLLAKLVSLAIGAGVELQHLSDMHDRMLLVVESVDAGRLAALYKSDLAGKTA